MRIAKTRIHGYVRINANELAQRHELVHADIVRLYGIPGMIKHRRALVDIADRIVPAPTREKVAARQTPHSGVKLVQERDCVRPEPLYVVCRHERDGADVKISSPRSSHFKNALISIG